jgi:hypothetical protein
MKSVGIFVFTFFIVIGASVGLALALDVDWKFYGGATLDDGVFHQCFYDANGIVKQPDTHMRIWTKCLSVKDIDSIETNKEPFNKIVENAAQKIARGYVPPIIIINKIEFDKIADITAAEQIADISDIQPSSRILYELDCSQMMLRELSIYMQQEGKTGTSNKPRDWQYFAPETNGATLSKILCPLR